MCCSFVFFFFKQKTAYEMRISDWSSDVCSSDLHDGVWPSDPDARAWAQCAACEMHSGFAALRGDCTMNVGVRVAPKPMSEALTANVARLRELFEEGLARFGGPWLAGAAFTAVDAFFAPVDRKSTRLNSSH